MADAFTAHIVSHTHWDREWYLPFQVFRFRLVRLIDRLLEILTEEEDFAHFTLDGQTVILQDYLEIRPERRDILERYIREGRILIGPWYTIPDEFLVSGEALIRNLLLGKRDAEACGANMAIGYLPDPFGHTSQMPQILRGFGYDAAVLWRGIGESIKQSEFMWAAPDGSEVFTVYLPFSYLHAQFLGPGLDLFLKRIAVARSELVPYATTRNILVMNGGDHIEAQRYVPELMRQAQPQFPDLILVHSSLPIYIAAVRGAGPPPTLRLEGELRSSQRMHLLPAVASSRIWIKQANVACQTALERWAEPSAAWVSFWNAELPSPIGAGPGKQALDGSAESTEALRQAWRYLLQNHAHDSICGCGVDQVHQEMRTRFDWALQIAEEIARHNLELIAARVNVGGLTTGLTAEESGRALPLVVFNPLAQARTDQVTAEVPLPAGAADIVVRDEGGRTIPHQVVSIEAVEIGSLTLKASEVANYIAMIEDESGRPSMERFYEVIDFLLNVMGEKVPRFSLEDVAMHPAASPSTIQVDVDVVGHGPHNEPQVRKGMAEMRALLARGQAEQYRFRFRQRGRARIVMTAGDVPAAGYRSYLLLPGHRLQPVTTGPKVSEARPNHFIENEFFTVQADPSDGTVTVVDKQSGAILAGCNRFVDGGDAGDEYTFAAPLHDRVVSEPARVLAVETEEAGPVRMRLRIDLLYALPAHLEENRVRRARALVESPITTRVTLYAGVRRVEFETEIENRACDHRLRVHFPTTVQTDHSLAENAFDVVRRPVAPLAGGPDWIEQPVTTYPAQTFVAVQDEREGVLVFNRGLPEYEILPGDQGVEVALTLLRSVGWLSRDDLPTRKGPAGPLMPTPGAQMLGAHTCAYGIAPYQGDVVAVIPEAHAFVAPLRALSAQAGEALLPVRWSAVEIQPPQLLMSSLKPSEDGKGIVVRIWNPSTTAREGHLRFGLPVRRVALVGLDEGERQVLRAQADGSYAAALRAKGILSVKAWLA